MAKRQRAYLKTTELAAQLLGSRVRQARIERRWTERELAERAGVSITTLRKVERGDPTVALGIAFDAAGLLGVPLFHEERDRLAAETRLSRDRARLLPKRVRPRRKDLANDF